MNACHAGRRATATFLASFLMLLGSGPRADTPAATGDLWEIVSQMSMEGFPMAMPAQTVKVCASKNSTEPPGANNDERGCTGSDYVYNEDQNSVTWTSIGDDGMTGQGEVTFDGEGPVAARFTMPQTRAISLSNCKATASASATISDRGRFR